LEDQGAEAGGSEALEPEDDDPLRPEEPNSEEPNPDEPSEEYTDHQDAGLYDPEDDRDQDPDDHDPDDEFEGQHEYVPESGTDEERADQATAPSPAPSLHRASLGQAISGAITAKESGSSGSAFLNSRFTGVRTDGSDPPINGQLITDPLITQSQKIAIRSLAQKIGLAHYQLTDVLYQQFGRYSLERLSKAQAHDLHVALQQALTEKKEMERKEMEKKEQERKEQERNEQQGQSVPSRNGHTVVAAN